jgi:hypothetical protein
MRNHITHLFEGKNRLRALQATSSDLPIESAPSRINRPEANERLYIPQQQPRTTTRNLQKRNHLNKRNFLQAKVKPQQGAKKMD